MPAALGALPIDTPRVVDVGSVRGSILRKISKAGHRRSADHSPFSIDVDRW
jgi:hypothetical protein